MTPGPNVPSPFPSPVPARQASLTAAADYTMTPSDLGGEPGERPQFARIVAALLRFKWLILGLTVLGTAGATVATRFITPEYEVQASIWVGSDAGRTGPIQAPELLEGRSWLELMQAYVVRDPVVQALQLYVTPKNPADSVLFRNFALGERYLPGEYELTIDRAGGQWRLLTNRAEVDRGGLGDSIGRPQGLRWAPPPEALAPRRSVPFALVTPRDASRQIAQSLRATMADRGNFIYLTMTGRDPHRAAETLNALGAQFVQVAADLKQARLRETSTALHDQLTKQGEALREAERALESFRVQTITLPSEQATVAPGLQSTQPTVISNYFAERMKQDGIQQDIRATENLLARAREGQLAVDAFLTVGAVRAAPDLNRVLQEVTTMEADVRSMRERYTDAHPALRDLRARLDTLRLVTVPRYTELLLEQLRIQERELGRRIDDASRQLQEIPTRTATEARLRRDAEAAALLFQNLQNRYEESRLAELSAIPDVRVMDSAVAPTRPTRNTAPRLILLGFAGSVGLAIGLAMLLDRLDTRFRYPDQVTHDLRLGILGAVPAIRHQRGNGVMAPEDAAQIVEAFREIRLNLAHAFPDGPIAFTVSSPGPGDGKSLIALRLAASFAQAGYRTVLVDGDTRRGELHRSFQVERRPGLLDYLGGEIEIEDLVRRTGHTNLLVIPAGTRRQDAPELLGTARMQRLITQLQHEHEVVLVDSPPLGVGVDPFILATMTGNIVLVLRSGETDRAMAEAKLHTMESLPIRILGAVLNDVRTGLGPYRYYSYTYGYAAEDEGGTSARPPVPASRRGAADVRS